jgi:ParB family chromosome partitioning protein
MNLTTVAHHLALLDLPPELDDALKSGRITSPRTLHELSNIHAEQPEQVRSLMSSGAEIKRVMSIPGIAKTMKAVKLESA